MSIATDTRDFTVADHGSVIILTPITAQCREWVEAHVGDDETQTWGRFGVVVEPRYIDPIVNALLAEGFAGGAE